MNKEEKRTLSAGLLLLAAFILWTALIQCVDVQPLGQNGTDIGFAALNCWFHRLCGVHMLLVLSVMPTLNDNINGCESTYPSVKI